MAALLPDPCVCFSPALRGAPACSGWAVARNGAIRALCRKRGVACLCADNGARRRALWAGTLGLWDDDEGSLAVEGSTGRG